MPEYFSSIYYKGIAIWGFKHAIDVVAKPAEKSEDGSCGEVSSFQALATALSGTIGIGSIAGVAISISIGGPGAAFWIFVGAILGMSIKFVEATLAVKYRRFNSDGSVFRWSDALYRSRFDKKKYALVRSAAFCNLCYSLYWRRYYRW